jgi:hypothetical protein
MKYCAQKINDIVMLCTPSGHKNVESEREMVSETVPK